VSDDRHYDVIIIGTGAGGGTLAHRLATSGKQVLLLERGGYLPRERDNWDSTAVFVHGKYRAPEFWYDANGDDGGHQPPTGGLPGVVAAAVVGARSP
jgi:choline dehydrogenase-like flavoprotein